MAIPATPSTVQNPMNMTWSLTEAGQPRCCYCCDVQGKTEYHVGPNTREVTPQESHFVSLNRGMMSGGTRLDLAISYTGPERVNDTLLLNTQFVTNGSDKSCFDRFAVDVCTQFCASFGIPCIFPPIVYYCYIEKRALKAREVRALKEINEFIDKSVATANRIASERIGAARTQLSQATIQEALALLSLQQSLNGGPSSQQMG